MEKKFILLGSMGMVLFSGCVGSSQYISQNFSKQVKLEVNNNKFDEQNEKFFQNLEIDNKEKYLDLSSIRTLRQALKELSKITGKVYYLKGSEELTLPSQDLQGSRLLDINSLKKLQKYIEITTNKKLVVVNQNSTNNKPNKKEYFDKIKMIKESKIIPNTPKVKKHKKIFKNLVILELKDQNKILKDFSNINFEVSGEQSIGDLLKTLAKITGYSIVYKYDDSSNNQSSTQETSFIPFSKNIVFYKGNNVADFLNYLSNMYDVYVNVDPDKKLITFYKYKTKMFSLITPNISIELNDNVNTDKTIINPINDKLNYSLTEKFINSLKNLLSSDKNSKILTTDNGLIVVKTTKNNMETIEKMFEKFNNMYSKQVKIKLELYEFLLSKNYNYGIDLNYKDNKNNFVTNYISNIIYSTMPNKYWKINMNANSNIIRFDKKYFYTFNVINNIPLSLDIQDKKDYLKSISTTTTSTTSTTTQTATEIGSVHQGQVLSVLARIIGNKVYIRTNLQVNTLNNMQTVNVNGTTLMLPSLSTKILPSTNILHFGDRKIIGMYETYANVKNYDGTLPLEGFIVGGTNGDKYVRKLIVVVLSVLNK